MVIVEVELPPARNTAGDAAEAETPKSAETPKVIVRLWEKDPLEPVREMV